MTALTTKEPDFVSRVINGLLSVKPLAEFAKSRARTMMIQRAQRIGVNWPERVEQLQALDWQERFTQIQNPTVTYPAYYQVSFHAYEKGDLSWDAAWEVECAALTVHSTLWGGEDPAGDRKLRDSYHNALNTQLSTPPQNILDLGCSTGMSTFALQDHYPQATLTGLDLSPYFLAVAHYNSEQQQRAVTWHHAPAEASGLPPQSFDLVSSCLMFHELPQAAARAILAEAQRLLRPGGYFALMDMNPRSSVYATMPPYILTLLKSTEPYLDQYFSLDLEQALSEAGFEQPTITPCTPRHRAVIAKRK
ncbi:class I SAM-dependent methyltransferase [Spirulina subsalsa]|uniref:class I SAM-dependent methyltransferase n=1 Tax=Spirulina subsalsa TaxID=54311 RepID=UPI000312E40F|nr:class I SAM-dependent methyltransferase [Spirulina subsalsa]